MAKLSVILVSASPVQRSRIARMLGALPGIDLIGTASNLSETFMLAEAREPQLVIMSEDFRTSEDFVAIKSLFYALDARWLFIDTREIQLGAPTMRLASGQVVAEPVLHASMTPETAQAVIDQIMRTGREPGTAAPLAVARSSAASEWLVVIGASTGGVDALLNVLSEYPENCPPTAIVQHTGRGFTESLVRLLDRRCRPRVVAAENGLVLQPGMVCVAAGTEGHLVLAPGGRLTCQIRVSEPISGHMPSCDALFRSAVPIASQVVGVLLTGMGQDGAEGLLELRRAGAVTIGQDQATSVVYGMPKVAWEIGAAQTQLPIGKIAREVLKTCAQPPLPRSKPVNSQSAL